MDSTTMVYREGSAPAHVAAMAYVGIFGVSCFVLSTFALLLVQPDRNGVAEPISYYVHGHHGWLLSLGLLALGLGSFALSIGVAQCVQRRAGTRGLALFGLGVALAGLFPADPWWPWEQATSMSAVVHGVATLVAMVAFAGTAIPLMRALQIEAKWDRVGNFFFVTAIAGVVGIVGCIVSLTARLPPQFLGMMERLMIGAGVAWLALIATGLLHAPVFSSRR